MLILNFTLRTPGLRFPWANVSGTLVWLVMNYTLAKKANKQGQTGTNIIDNS